MSRLLVSAFPPMAAVPWLGSPPPYLAVVRLRSLLYQLDVAQLCCPLRSLAVAPQRSLRWLVEAAVAAASPRPVGRRQPTDRQDHRAPLNLNLRPIHSHRGPQGDSLRRLPDFVAGLYHRGAPCRFPPSLLLLTRLVRAAVEEHLQARHRCMARGTKPRGVVFGCLRRANLHPRLRVRRTDRLAGVLGGRLTTRMALVTKSVKRAVAGV